MKKLLFILAVVLLSCEKEEVFCWNCRRDVTTPMGYYSVMIEVCGQSESDIRAFEQDNSSLAGTTTKEMTCWKRGESPITGK